MAAFDEVTEALKQAGERLDSPAFEPAPTRNWNELEVEEVRRIIDGALRNLPAARAELGADDAARLEHIATRLASSTAAVLFVSGNRSLAEDLLTRAAGSVSDGLLREELRAGAQHLEWNAQLAHARWLARQKRSGRALRLATTIARRAPHEALRRAAIVLRETPEPVDSAPGLGTVNGFGFRLSGHRDEWPDGSYVSTLCFTALYIPVLPISAYRVVRDRARYGVIGKVPLSAFALWYRRLLGLALVVVLGGVGLGAYLHSPDRLASIRLTEAQRLERAQPGAALAAYEGLLELYGNEPASESASRMETVSEAAQAWVRMKTAAVPEPMTAEHVDEVERLVRRYQDLTGRPRRPAAAGMLVGKLRAWASQVQAGPAASPEAALRLLGAAQRVAIGTDKDALAAEERRVRKGIAQSLEASWPQLALDHDVKLAGDPEALSSAARLLGKVKGDATLLADNEQTVRAWIDAAGKSSEHAALAKELGASLASALAEARSSARAELLASSELPTVQAAYRRAPRDQAVTAHLARLRRARGQSREAVALLGTLGEPGWLSKEGQLTLAAALADQGKAAEARPLLQHYLDRWLPRFLASREQLTRADDELRNELIANARLGQLPAELRQKLDAEKIDERQQELLRDWLTSRLASDKKLTQLRGAYEEHLGVVSAAMLLGTLDLSRAAAATGAERERLLQSIERTFLSVQQEAEGSPQFHLVLGQVYHRLGKAEDGEKQMKAVLARREHRFTQAVGEAYRELGLIQKARELFEAELARGDQPWRDQAARTLALMASTEKDKETWLLKVQDKTPVVQTMLADTRADIYVSEGRLADADRELEKVTAYYSRFADTDASSANNAGLAYRQRYACTGDRKHLDQAVRLLEQSMHASPDSAIVVQNLAATLEFRAQLALLEPFVHTQALKLQSHEAEQLVPELAGGPARESLLAAARASPDARRALELARKAELLAPKSVESYQVELRWAELFRDTDALKGLRQRIEQAGGMDDTVQKEMQGRWERGEQDERLKSLLGARLKTLEPALAEPHPPTRAAALVLKGWLLARLATLDVDPEQAQQGVDALREAARIDPQGGAKNDLTGALLNLAVLRAAKQSAPLAERWQKERRQVDAALFSYRAKAEPALMEALRAQPALREAAGRVRTKAREALGVTDWIAAWATGDAEQMARTRQELAGERRMLDGEVEALLERGNPSTEARWALHHELASR